MADNVTTQTATPATIPGSTPLASRAITYSGDAVQLPASGIVLVAGSDDAKTNADLSGGAGATDAGTVRVVPATDGTVLGPVTETAPATDTASSGLNGRLQRIAQRISSLIALLPSALGAGGGLKVDGSGTALPVSGTVTITPSGTQAVSIADGSNTTFGAEADAASAGDTTTTTYMALFKRLLQRITSLLAVFPTTIDTNSGAKSASTLRVVLATDQPQLTAKLLVTPDLPANAAQETGGNLATLAGAVASAHVQTVATTRWASSPTSRSTGLTTELNSLTNGSYSAQGTAFDNTLNLDEYAACDIVLASLNPTAGAYLQIFLSQSLDGTTYEDAPSSTNPGTHQLMATVLVTTGAAAKRVMTPWFRIPPGKFKLVLLNQTGVSLAASGNTVTLYTSNDKAS